MSLDNPFFNGGDHRRNISGPNQPEDRRSQFSQRELLTAELANVIWEVSSNGCPHARERLTLDHELERISPTKLLEALHKDLNVDLFDNEIRKPSRNLLSFNELLSVVERQLHLQADPGPLMPGTVLRPLSMVVDRFLARGGRNAVYLAESPNTGELVVVKTPLRSHGGSKEVRRFSKISSERAPWGVSPDESPPDAVFVSEDGFRLGSFSPALLKAALRTEAQLLSKLQHPGLVRSQFLVEDQKVPYLVLDYIQGDTLRTHMRAPQQQLRPDFFSKLVKTLIELKGKGLAVHGALSPDEIMINQNGDPILLTPAFRTAGNHVLRTSSHYNPMLLEKGQADVLALGIIFYEMRTGDLPWKKVPFSIPRSDSDSRDLWMDYSLALSHTPARDLNPRIDPKAAEIIRRCLIAPQYKIEELYKDLRDNPGII